MLGAVVIDKADVDIATLTARFDEHIRRYERDHSDAKIDRQEIKTDLGELKNLLHEVKGGQKLAKWVAGAVIVPTLTLLGFPKIAAVFAAIGR